jgi:hypothetical protein
MELAKRYKLIACEILFRELSYCASMSKNIIDVVFLPKRLHDVGEKKMSTRLQAEIDQVDPASYDAVLLGYGLCNHGIRGLRASLPMVVTRAHDCITLLLGSKEAYQSHFDQHPGTFYHSPGWIERDQGLGNNDENIFAQLGMNSTYQEYVEKYGEENARYLMEMFGDLLKNYHRLAYIDCGIGDFCQYKNFSREEAQKRNWEYEEIQGNLDLLMRLVNGDWDPQDFLVIPPQKTIQPSYDARIITEG